MWKSGREPRTLESIRKGERIMNSLDSYFLHIKISNDGFEIWDTDQEGATDKLNLTQTLDKLKEILEAKDGICDFNYIRIINNYVIGISFCCCYYSVISKFSRIVYKFFRI